MSRKAYCRNCPENELVTDEEQEVGYCDICIDNGDIEIPEPYFPERVHPDEKGNEGRAINED